MAKCYGLVGDATKRLRKCSYIDDMSMHIIVRSFRSLDAQTVVCSVRSSLFRKPRWEILLEQVWVVAFGDVGMAPKHDNPRQLS
jgi:hypothetical protein